MNHNVYCSNCHTGIGYKFQDFSTTKVLSFTPDENYRISEISGKELCSSCASLEKVSFIHDRQTTLAIVYFLRNEKTRILEKMEGFMKLIDILPAHDPDIMNLRKRMEAQAQNFGYVCAQLEMAEKKLSK